MKTLGGVFFVKDGLRYDYCFKESIECLCELCDEVSVIEVGSSDGTFDVLDALSKQNSNLTITSFPLSHWDERKGRERISLYQNIAKSLLSTNYYYLQQADEITKEDSFKFIRDAIESGEDGIICSRINLWRDCNSYLAVPENRQPCSTKIIRLAKTEFNSIDDGESISANAISKYVNDIRIYHYGFVRKKEVMKDKIFNMQENVFEIAHDPKLDNMKIFDWSAWFSEEDLQTITEPHPKFIREWVKSRP